MMNQYSKPTMEVMDITVNDWSLYMEGSNIGGCNAFDAGDRVICG